jgi:hypothetical protein
MRQKWRHGFEWLVLAWPLAVLGVVSIHFLMCS